MLTDILPLRPGHTLVIPKTHCKHVSELPDELAGAVGQAVSKVAKALTKGTYHLFQNHSDRQESNVINLVL